MESNECYPGSMSDEGTIPKWSLQFRANHMSTEDDEHSRYSRRLEKLDNCLKYKTGLVITSSQNTFVMVNSSKGPSYR